jgi:hypothetical protein
MSVANVRRDGVGNPGLNHTRGSPGDATRIVGVGDTDLRIWGGVAHAVETA